MSSTIDQWCVRNENRKILCPYIFRFLSGLRHTVICSMLVNNKNRFQKVISEETNMAGGIYITGDMHRDLGKFEETYFSQQRNLDKEDYVIVCGDFGVIWDVQENVCETVQGTEREKRQLERLEKYPFTTLFVDGNHENFDRLYSYPIEEWHGGKVHKISESVIHLLRGQVYTIEGQTIFTFGGARSHDISGGVLEVKDPKFEEKINSLLARRESFRINHVSWWKEEMPSDEEMEEGWENLKRHGKKVDYIISHCCPSQLHHLISKHLEDQNELTSYFDSIWIDCEYKRWYFGHYHEDRNLSSKEVLLYNQIIKLGDMVDETKPILGKPRYVLYQPVKFLIEIGDVQEVIGIIINHDPYGTFSNPYEPSYDIFAKIEIGKHGSEAVICKHNPESKVEALTEEEIDAHSRVISYLATMYSRK